MKSSTSADTVVMTDQQGKQELATIFAKNGTVGCYKTSSVLTGLNLCKVGCILKNSVASKHADSGHW